MFVFGNLMAALAVVLDWALYLYLWLIIIRALASWLSPDPYNPVFRILIRLTEPVLGRVRRALPFLVGVVDLSPIVVILALVFLQRFLVPTLNGIAARLG